MTRSSSQAPAAAIDVRPPRIEALSARLRAIMALGLPIMGGMASQNVLNLVDTAMVGRLGDTALAAVGIASFLNFTLAGLVLGVSAGVQAIVSRRVGEGRADQAAVALNTALLLVVAVTLPWSALSSALAPYLMSLLNEDPAVVEVGTPYLQARLIGMVAVASNYAFRGYWNGISKSRLYLRTLVLMHSVNVVLNYCLIFGNFGLPRLEVLGAGVGTMIATFVGTAYYLSLGVRHAGADGFLRRLAPRATAASIVRLSVPNGIQTLFFAAGQATLFAIIARIGTAELAATNVLINVMLVVVLPCIGLGLAAATLVGQALGRNDPEDASRWGTQVAGLAALGLTALGLPMLLFPDAILGVFLTDPDTVELARLPLRIFASLLPVEAAGLVMMQALIGAGATRAAMTASLLTQWGLTLPGAYLVGVVLGQGLLGAWIVQAIARSLFAAACFALWRKGGWASVKV